MSIQPFDPEVALKLVHDQVIEEIKTHPMASDCPVCGLDISKVALVDLVYIYKKCDCDHVHYTHLVQRGHHKECVFKTDQSAQSGI